MGKDVAVSKPPHDSHRTSDWEVIGFWEDVCGEDQVKSSSALLPSGLIGESEVCMVVSALQGGVGVGIRRRDYETGETGNQCLAVARCT